MSNPSHSTHDQCGLCAAPAYAFSIDVMALLCVDHLAAFEDWCDEHRDTPSSAFMATAEGRGKVESIAAKGLREAADFLDSIAHGPTATVYVTGHRDGRVNLSWQHQDFLLPTDEQRALARWMVRNVDADWRRSQHGTDVDFTATIGRLGLRVTVDAAKKDDRNVGYEVA